MVSMVRTDKIGELLYIPTEGVLQVYQREVDPVSLLTDTGKYICLHVGHHLHVHFRATDQGATNLRAQTVLSLYTDVQVQFTGPVLFDGLPGDHIFEIVSFLSQEGTTP